MKSMLAVDDQEAGLRGLYDQQQDNGTAEVSGMLALLIGRDRKDGAA